MQNPDNPNRIDHLANERTFLAWIRTCVGIMAFGFVVEKFAFFMKQITAVLSLPAPHHPKFESHSSTFGIYLVAFGSLLCILAFIKFKNVEKQINENSYRPSILLDTMLTLFVVLIGLFLTLYLLNSL